MENIGKTDIQIESIGNIAVEMLSSKQTGTIFGTSSRGIFVNFNKDRMIFLSFEEFRGPLTINVSGDIQLLSNFSSGEKVLISREGIQFPDTGITISTKKPFVWKPTAPTGKVLLPKDRKNLIRKIAMYLYKSRNGVGLSEMLPVLAGFHPSLTNENIQSQGIRKQIDNIRNHLAQGDLSSLFQTIQPFIGMGSGLTPSGDDFVMGLLLSLNRWESVLHPGENLSVLNTNVVEAAYRCTTTLSANLIECGALGLADERLIQAVDFLATGENCQAEILPGLLSWGSTSGIDAFVGMIVAFLPI